MRVRILALAAFLAIGTCCACGSAGATPAQKAYDADQVSGIVDEVVDGLWAKTDYYWHKGDYPRIIALDRIIVEADPSFMEPYAVGGWLMESDGDLADAESFYKLGCVRNPTSSYMFYNLSAFYMNTLKNYALAVKASESGVRQADAGINDWRMLAHAYEKNHQLEEALATWKTMKTRWPDGLAIDHNRDRVERLIEAGASAQPTPPSVAQPQRPVVANPVLSL